jgi:peptidoglycan/xylan/chitin deacetylase (PgdA/CDA1 family)
MVARTSVDDLELVLAQAQAQLAFLKNNVALGVMAPVPYATRIARAVLVLAMGFVTGEQDRFDGARRDDCERGEERGTTGLNNRPRPPRDQTQAQTNPPEVAIQNLRPRAPRLTRFRRRKATHVRRAHDTHRPPPTAPPADARRSQRPPQTNLKKTNQTALPRALTVATYTAATLGSRLLAAALRFLAPYLALAACFCVYAPPRWAVVLASRFAPGSSSGARVLWHFVPPPQEKQAPSGGDGGGGGGDEDGGGDETTTLPTPPPPPPPTRFVALTIDDGPCARTTPLILEALAQNGARATHFIIGEHVDACDRFGAGEGAALLGRALLKRMLLEGHELGNHTARDRKTISVPLRDLERELQDVRALLDQAVGDAAAEVSASAMAAQAAGAAAAAALAGGASAEGQTSSSAAAAAAAAASAFIRRHLELVPRWFRPGHGWYNVSVLDAAERLGGQTTTVLGSVWPWDTVSPFAYLNAAFVALKAYSGAVIVLHDGRVHTPATLKLALPWLRARGFDVVTLGEAAARSGALGSPGAAAAVLRAAAAAAAEAAAAAAVRAAQAEEEEEVLAVEEEERRRRREQQAGGEISAATTTATAAATATTTKPKLTAKLLAAHDQRLQQQQEQGGGASGSGGVGAGPSSSSQQPKRGGAAPLQQQQQQPSVRLPASAAAKAAADATAAAAASAAAAAAAAALPPSRAPSIAASPSDPALAAAFAAAVAAAGGGGTTALPGGNNNVEAEDLRRQQRRAEAERRAGIDRTFANMSAAEYRSLRRQEAERKDADRRRRQREKEEKARAEAQRQWEQQMREQARQQHDYARRVKGEEKARMEAAEEEERRKQRVAEQRELDRLRAQQYREQREREEAEAKARAADERMGEGGGGGAEAAAAAGAKKGGGLLGRLGRR